MDVISPSVRNLHVTFAALDQWDVVLNDLGLISCIVFGFHLSRQYSIRTLSVPFVRPLFLSSKVHPAICSSNPVNFGTKKNIPMYCSVFSSVFSECRGSMTFLFEIGLNFANTLSALGICCDTRSFIGMYFSSFLLNDDMNGEVRCSRLATDCSVPEPSFA